MPASRKANSNDVNRSRCFPTPLVKNIRLGTMSLPNSVASGTQNYESENAQFNTMVCKESVNLTGERKKAGSRWRGSRFSARSCLGEGAGQNATQCITRLKQIVQESFSVRISEHNPLGQRHGQSLLRGDRTDLDGVAVQGAGDGGSFAGLLVESG